MDSKTNNPNVETVRDNKDAAEEENKREDTPKKHQPQIHLENEDPSIHDDPRFDAHEDAYTQVDMYSYNEDHHGTDEIETTTGELEGAEITVYQMGDSVLANLEAELEAKTIRKTAKKRAILEMVQQEIQKAIFQGDVAQHFGNILDAVKERERQLHTTISNMKADHTKLIDAQNHLIHINDQVQTALAHQETLMLKLKTENEKLTFEYNRLKYQRQADVRTMIQHEEEELKRGIDRTSTSILAENERAFQQLRNARIQSHTADLERICGDHIQRLNRTYEEKNNAMTQDLDALALEMTIEFQDTWNNYRQNQLPDQVQGAIQDLSTDALEVLEEQIDHLKEHLSTHGKTLLVSIDTTTAISLQQIRTTAAYEKEQLQDSCDTEKAKLQATIDKTPDITEIAKKGMDQLRSETGRLKKELETAKNESLLLISNDKHAAISSLRQEFDRCANAGLGQSHHQDNHSLRQPSMEETQSKPDSTPHEDSPQNLAKPRNEEDLPLHATKPTKSPIYGDHGDSFAMKTARYEDFVRKDQEQQANDARTQTIRERSHLVLTQLRPLQLSSFDVVPHGLNEPTITDIEQFYRDIVTILHSLQLPIHHYADLTLTSGTYPSEEPIEPQTYARLAAQLYSKLNQNIPSHWNKIRSILKSHSTSQDGYKALFSIMTNMCGFLRIFRTPWGPEWTNDMNAFDYSTALQNYLVEAERFGQMHSPFEQAAEILQQAQKHEKYSFVTTACLSKLQDMNPKEPIHPTFELQKLIQYIDQNPKPTSVPDITIKFRMNPSHEGGKNNEPKTLRRKFTYRREVQCQSCTTYGHDIDEDVCRIGAQVFASYQFLLKHPKKAESNAKAYALANNKAKIAAAISTFPAETEWEEIQHHLLILTHELNRPEQDEEPRTQND